MDVLIFFQVGGIQILVGRDCEFLFLNVFYLVMSSEGGKCQQLIEFLYVFLLNVEVGIVFIFLVILGGVVLINNIEFIGEKNWIIIFKVDLKKIFRE